MNTVQQLSLFSPEEMGGFSLEEVIQAYHVCLRGKGGTAEAQKFSYRYMSECVSLQRELNEYRYVVSRYIVFISFRPVQREIFGSAFRDRVVDTLIATKLMPVIDQLLVDDNYSTRKDKGSLYGVMRVYDMIRQCSADYTRDCWILKDDISSFFMTLLKDRTMQLWTEVVRNGYTGNDRELIIDTLRRIIYDRPELNCVLKGKQSDYNGLPPGKILRNSDGRRGFPIGKVISQISALLYLHELDAILTFIEQVHNGHYMDDRAIVGESVERLMELKRLQDRWHSDHGLQTHPRKTYLQHYSKGVLFGGAMILPGRIYLSNRPIGNCFRRLAQFNHKAQTEQGYVEQHAEEFASTMNSYFGLMGHYAEWNTAHRVIREIAPEWFKVLFVVCKKGKIKVSVNPQYREMRMVAYRHRRRIRYFLNYDNRRSMCPAA